jgi:inner membrane protein
LTLGTHLAFASILYLGGATLFGYRPDWVSCHESIDFHRPG